MDLWVLKLIFLTFFIAMLCKILANQLNLHLYEILLLESPKTPK